jgi:hypothetical protein
MPFSTPHAGRPAATSLVARAQHGQLQGSRATSHCRASLHPLIPQSSWRIYNRVAPIFNYLLFDDWTLRWKAGDLRPHIRQGTTTVHTLTLRRQCWTIGARCRRIRRSGSAGRGSERSMPAELVDTFEYGEATAFERPIDPHGVVLCRVALSLIGSAKRLRMPSRRRG